MEQYAALSATIWIVFLGICFGAFYAYYYRRILGDLLRALIAQGAEDEKTAKTLSEIGYGGGLKHLFAARALKKGAALRKTVETVYEEQLPHRKSPDELFVRAQKAAAPQRYYVPEEKRFAAEVRYDGEGTTVTTLLLTVGVFFVAAIVTMSLLPWILNHIGLLFGSSGTGSQTDLPPESGVESNLESDADSGSDSDSGDGSFSSI